MFNKKVVAAENIYVKELDYDKGSVIISYNTITFHNNLSSINMKDFNELKDIIINDVIEKNAFINVDVKELNIPNSSIIALITIIAKTVRLEYHKDIKIFFSSQLDWQVKMIKNIFKNSGPCNIEDIKEKVTQHSLINNYYSF